ncbi:MAG: hypothetical protein HF962_00565, partial [Sulfurovum sp.]|nr:hypothetical protein [Sulfurovum sp.]
VETERAVLCGIIEIATTDRDAALSSLREEHFFKREHKQILTMVKEIERRHGEVSLEMIRAEAATIESFSNEALEAVVRTEPILHMMFGFEKLVEWQSKRVLWRACVSGLEGIAQATAANSASILSKEVDRVLLCDSTEVATFIELEERYKDEPPTPIYQTGVAFYDQRAKGLHGGMLYAVMGDPDAGKTSFVVQVLKNCATAGVKCMFFPLEFSAKNMVIKNKHKNFTKKNLFIEDRFTDIYKIESLIKRYAAEGVRVVAIDSQMVVSVPGDFGNSSLREAEKFRILQRLAIVYGLSILFVCQQSNAHSAGGEIMPMGSKHAAHFVHTIWFFKKPKAKFNNDGDEIHGGNREFMQTKSKGAGGYFKTGVEINKDLEFRGIRQKKDYIIEYEDERAEETLVI